MKTNCLPISFTAALMLAAASVFAAPAAGPGENMTFTLQIPAGNAYVLPDAEGADVSAEKGVTGWTNQHDRIAWYGQLKAKGPLRVALTLRLPAMATSRLKLTVAKQSRTAEATGAGGAPVTVDFGTVNVTSPGPYRFELEGRSKSGVTFGDLDSLDLGGPAAQGAHFSMAKTRGAPSVHLWYTVPKDTPVKWFYNEVTVRTDPLWSYYMACGFSRGYFGIQVNSPTERRIIFSVWDSGSEPVDRTKVAPDNRVQLLAKGPGVFAGSFGNEGTGGHSHLVYPWKTGHTYRFLVTAQPDGTHTIYSGYFYFPEQNRWGLIASFRAPKDGGYLKGLYSFNEDFNGANGEMRRRAEFGPQWIMTADGRWIELTTATFTHTADGKTERLDRGAGVIHGRFYLTNGGFVPLTTKYGDKFSRAASGKPPANIALP
ncbi:MAG TPA: DUF3472 domain-containing protein [Armatimonadota bacterium]|nr:DUF3472 domain-containing protein [Armatimonadota bacterium]